MSTGSVPDESSSGTADPCAAAVIVPQSDPDATPSGFTRCANGMLRRVDAVQCVGPMPADACTNPDASACQVAADCVERGFGACVDAFDGIGSCTCVYGCETDDDCPTGEVCVCGGDAPGYPAVNACVPADCTTDIDCPGGACALGQVDACLARYGLACISGAEECVSQEQCEEFEECGPHDPDLPWTCEPRRHLLSGVGDCPGRWAEANPRTNAGVVAQKCNRVRRGEEGVFAMRSGCWSALGERCGRGARFWVGMWG